MSVVSNPGAGEPLAVLEKELETVTCVHVCGLLEVLPQSTLLGRFLNRANLNVNFFSFKKRLFKRS